MIRIETTQGTLARRGFVDAKVAERVIDGWDDAYEPLLDVLAQSADPDHALMALDRLCDRVPELLSRLTAAPVLARQLIMVLGASSRLAQHLIAHPEHIDLLERDLVKTSAASAAARAAGSDGRRPRSCDTDSYRSHRRRAAHRLSRSAASDCGPRRVCARAPRGGCRHSR